MVKLHKQTILEALGRSPVHPFPARMAPGIALAALGEGKAALRVLDPMVGSGTVLAVARAKGHHAIGVDLDPMAVLLARVWTRTIDAEKVKEKAVEALARAKGVFREVRSREAYPAGSDAKTREFIRYWFDDDARRQLSALSTAIRRVRDEATRDALWCAFSRLIIAKSAGASRAMDLAHSRPHRSFKRAPVKPFRRFLAAVSTVVANCPQRGRGKVGPVAVARHGDARQMVIPKASIDLVLTSPPYLNGIDYLRCSKFSLVWMGYNVDEIRQIRSASVGAEASSDEALKARWVRSVTGKLKLKPPLRTREHALFARYVWDMGRALAETSRVLRPGGRAVYVVGDSTCRGTFIRNSSVIIAAGKRHGLRVVSRQSRALPANRRYLPPPKRRPSKEAMDARMRREVVITFRKPRPRSNNHVSRRRMLG
jgi:tRNA G10  N-methylase Trm11